MGEVVNLRLARKTKARADKESIAAGNRVRHGRTKAERELEQAKAAKAASVLDGHQLSSRSPEKP